MLAGSQHMGFKLVKLTCLPSKVVAQPSRKVPSHEARYPEKPGPKRKIRATSKSNLAEFDALRPRTKRI